MIFFYDAVRRAEHVYEGRVDLFLRVSGFLELRLMGSTYAIGHDCGGNLEE